MFIYFNNNMYQITLESVKEKYRRTVTENLSSVFKGKLLENIVKEVMHNTVFNPVYDTNSVLIETRDGFRTLVLTETEVKLSGLFYKVDILYPKYVGPNCEEMKKCFEYSIDIFQGKEGISTPYFLKVADKFELFRKSSEENYKKVEAIINEYYTKKVASTIIKKLNKELIFQDAIFTACVNNEGTECIQVIDSSFEIKTTVISVEKIKEVILESLPKFKAVANTAEEIANRLYNYIKYGIDEKSRKLPKPVKVKNGNFVFTIKENNLSFYFDSNSHKWISEKILVSTDKLVWEKEKEKDSETATKMEKATYKGLKVATSECGEENVNNQKYDPNIPWVAGKRLRSELEPKYCNYMGSFPMNYGSIAVLPCETAKSFKCYICIEL